ncbi:hypothetical protein IWZ01DRAFT_22664 [Phyllosticta capitalensis]
MSSPVGVAEPWMLACSITLSRFVLFSLSFFALRRLDVPLTLPCLVRPSMIGNYSHVCTSRQIIVRQAYFKKNEYGAPAPFIARAWARASGGFAPALALALSIAMDYRSLLDGVLLPSTAFHVTGRLNSCSLVVSRQWQLSVSRSVIGFLQRHPGSIAHARSLRPRAAIATLKCPLAYLEACQLYQGQSKVGMLLAVCFVL